MPGAKASWSSRIQNASCFDVIFTSDSSGTTKIPWEVESCNQSTRAMVAWFLVSSMSSSADTKVYVHYDNGSISAPENTGGNAPAAIWDSNFKAVWHLGDGTTLSGFDSTTNAVTLTKYGATATTGELDGAVSWYDCRSSLYGRGDNPHWVHCAGRSGR
jgi:hypothetical protein